LNSPRHPARKNKQLQLARSAYAEKNVQNVFSTNNTQQWIISFDFD
jgi:hypothetical protein